jgi:hypothetical protein
MSRLKLVDNNDLGRHEHDKKKTRNEQEDQICITRRLEYKAPKIGVESEWFNTVTSSVFILF